MGYKRSIPGTSKVKPYPTDSLNKQHIRILTMTKHNGYDLVRPMFISGKLKGFTAIFKLVPKSVVAVDLGKEKGRFNKLIEDPDDLIYQEIRLFGALCDMAPFEMGILIEMEHPSPPVKNDLPKDYKYEAIRPAFETRTIRY